MDAQELLRRYGAGERNFVRASLRQVQLPGATLNQAVFAIANFSGANLSGALLVQAFMLVTNLCAANLSDADLTGACLGGPGRCGLDGRQSDRGFSSRR